MDIHYITCIQYTVQHVVQVFSKSTVAYSNGVKGEHTHLESDKPDVP